MIKLIDISFYAGNKTDRLAAQIEQHHAAMGYIDHFKKLATVQVIKHAGEEEVLKINDVEYAGFRRQNSFWQIPLRTIRYIKKQRADVILVQGLVFPLQVIWLKRSLPPETIILVQHHGEKPLAGIKGWLQQYADRLIDGYLFTGIGNATQWVNVRTIKSNAKCFELLEASTDFSRRDKEISRYEQQLTGNCNFLWVGRLNTGKDPLTIIKAFQIFCVHEPLAKLYMIFQTDELLPEIKKIIEENKYLEEKIILVGKVAHEALESWYSAADFYISGSHFEGSGYALLEAMACGCIPVVTAIPPFNAITANGKYAILFEAGNVEALVETMKHLHTIEREKMSTDIIGHFREQLSFKAIATNLFLICKKLTGK